MSNHRDDHTTDLHEPVHVKVVANEDRTKLTDTRLLIIFVCLVVLLGGGATYVKAQLDAVSANCQSNRANTLAFNGFITKLQRVTLGSPQLTPAQKRQRMVFYQTGKQPVPRCPEPFWGKPDPGDTDPPSPLPTVPLRSPS